MLNKENRMDGLRDGDKVVQEDPFWHEARHVESQSQHQWINTRFADGFFRRSYWYSNWKGHSEHRELGP